VLLESGIHVFTELNLISDGYKNMVGLAKDHNCTLFLSSTLLYRKDLQYIIESVRNEKVNYNYHVGQYLPDWHPWESYKNFFVQDVRTNGCREIFAIDLPWILAAMGPVKEMHVLCDNLTNPDNYIVQVLHENGSKGTILVDVVSRKAVRSLEVYSQDIYLKWEGNPNALYEYNFDSKTMDQIMTYGTIDKDNGYSDTIIENAYQDELNTFFDVIAGKTIPRYTFANDFKTLELIDKIEANAKKG
jgi:predicted dehydrogenase